MEGCVQVLVSNRVAYRYQDFLAFLLDDLVSDEGCSFYLIGVELFKLVATLVKFFFWLLFRGRRFEWLLIGWC